MSVQQSGNERSRPRRGRRPRQIHPKDLDYIGPEGGGWEIATPNRVMQSNDVLLVAGEPKLAEHFGLLE